MSVSAFCTRLLGGAFAALLTVSITNTANASCFFEGCLGSDIGVEEDYSITFSVEENGISYYEIEGNFDRGNQTPRKLLLKKFYERHEDDYDFVVVLTDFEFETNGALAFYNSIKNDVEGIGQALFDRSSLYGSDGRLQGLIDLAAAERYVLNPKDPRYERVLIVLAHELLHRYGIYINYLNSDGEVSDDLLGQHGAHWSNLLDTDASVQYGNNWRKNDDGTFTSVGIRKFYSDLDLYLMGLLPVSEVSDVLLLKNPELDKAALPALGLTIEAETETISVNQIIAAEGERIPSFEESQKKFNIGFIVVSRPGNIVSVDVKEGVKTLQRQFSERFALMTRGRGIANIVFHPENALDVFEGKAFTPLPTLSNASIELANSYIQTSFNLADGWADSVHTQVRDSVAAYRYLTEVNAHTGLTNGFIDSIHQFPVSSIDVAQSLYPLADAEQLAQIKALVDVAQSDEGWGLTAQYISSALDTAKGLLLASNLNSANHRQSAINNLLALQNDDGGWPMVQGGESDVLATVEIVSVLKTLATVPEAETVNAFAYLQNSTADLAALTSLEIAQLIHLYSEANQLNSLDTEALFNELNKRQRADGSWDYSIYATVQVVKALSQLTMVNLEFSSVKLSQESFKEGQFGSLSVNVFNASSEAVPASTLKAEHWLNGELLATETIAINALGAEEVQENIIPVTTLNRASGYIIRLILDADNTVAELSEADNSLEVVVPVSAAPEQVDLSLNQQALYLLPELPSVLPSTQGVSVDLFNASLVDAENVLVQLYEVITAEEQHLLDEVTVNVANRTSVPVNLSHQRENNGPIHYRVTVDPHTVFADDAKTDNEIEFTINTQASQDLSVDAESIIVPEHDALYAGKTQTLQLKVSNRGTLRTDAVKVRAVAESVKGTELLFETSHTFGAGETEVFEAFWRPAESLTYTLRLEVDPNNIVTEFDEENNSVLQEVHVEAVDGINLVVDTNAVQFAPETGVQSGSAVFQAQVRNAGTESAQSVTVQLFNGNPTQGGTLLDSMTIPELASDTETTVELNWSGIDANGRKFVYIVADLQNQITETDETDNSALVEFLVYEMQDAAITNASLQLFPAYPITGEPLELQITVANQGAGLLSGLPVSVYATDADTETLIATAELTELTGFNSKTLSVDLTDQVSASTSTLRVQLNPERAVAEQNYENNSAQMEVRFQSQALYVTEKYFSPNGDGVKDNTTLFYKVPSQVQAVMVRAVSNDSGEAVQISDAINVTGNTASWRWEGKNSNGTVVDDGQYRLEVLDEASNKVLASVVTEVDNNRSSLITALKSGEYLTLPLYNDELNGSILGYNQSDLLAVRSANNAIDIFNLQTNETRTIISDGDEYDLGGAADDYFVFWTDGDRYLDSENNYVSQTIEKVFVYNYSDDNLLSVDVSTLKETYGEKITDSFDSNTDVHFFVVAEGFYTLVCRHDQIFPYYYVIVENPDEVHCDIWFYSLAENYIRLIHQNIYFASVALPTSLNSYEMNRLHFDITSITGNKLVVHADTRYVSDDVTWQSLRSANSATAVVDLETQEVEYINGALAYAPDGKIAKVTYSDKKEYTGRNDPASSEYYKYPEIQGALSIEVFAADGSVLLEDSIDILLQEAEKPPIVDLQWNDFSDEFVFSSGYSLFTCSGGQPFSIYRYSIRQRAASTEFMTDDYSCIDLDKYFSTAYVVIGNVDFQDLESGDVFQARSYNGIPFLAVNTFSIFESYIEPYGTLQTTQWLPNSRNVVIYARAYPESFRGTTAAVERSISGHVERALIPLNSDYATFSENGDIAFDDKNILKAQTNLSVNFQALLSASGTGFEINGTVTDKNFESYRLEAKRYPDGQWSPVKTGQEKVINGAIATWSPLIFGQYDLRLTVYDKAGNQLSALRRVVVGDVQALFDFNKNPDYISPNDDGVADELVIDFKLAKPTAVNVEIFDSNGGLVREWSTIADDLTNRNTVRWNGRSQSGTVVPDGLYTVALNGLNFYVTVDTTYPEITFSTIEPLVYSAKSADNKPIVIRRLNTSTFPKINQVRDTNIRQWRVEYRAFGSSEWLLVDNAMAQTTLPDVFLTLGYELAVEQEDEVRPYLYDREIRIVATDLAGNTSIENLSRYKRNKIALHQYGEVDLEQTDVTINAGTQMYEAKRKTVSLSVPDSKNWLWTFKNTIEEPILQHQIKFRPVSEEPAAWSEPVTVPFAFCETDENQQTDCSEQEGVNGESTILLTPDLFTDADHYQLVLIVDTETQTIESQPVVFKVDRQPVSYHALVNADHKTVKLRHSINAPVDHWQVSIQGVSNEQGIDTSYLVEKTIAESSVPNFSVTSDGLYQQNTVSLPSLKKCLSYKVTSRALSENNEVLVALDEVITNGCVDMAFMDAVQFSDDLTCGTDTQQPVQLGLKLPPYPVWPAVVKVSFVDEKGGTHSITNRIVPDKFAVKADQADHFSWQKGAAGEWVEFWFEFDQTLWPHATAGTIQVEVVDELGHSSYLDAPWVIDREPATLELSYPRVNEKICPSDVLTAVDASGQPTGELYSVLSLEGLLKTTFDSVEASALPTLEALQSDATLTIGSEVRETLERLNQPSFKAGNNPPLPLGAYRFKTPQSVPGASLIVPGDLGNTLDISGINGSAQLSIEWNDHSGIKQCRAVQLNVDGIVQAQAMSGVEYFSPNGDAINDDYSFSVTASESVLVTAVAYEAVLVDNKLEKGAAVRQILMDLPAGEGVTHFSWDGRTDEGGIAADGNYFVELTLEDGCGNRSTYFSNATIDTEQPVLAFMSPKDGDDISLITPVNVNAIDANPARSELRYSLDQGQTWQPIADIQAGNWDAQLAAEFNSAAIEGEVIFRLVSEDKAGNSATLDATVTALPSAGLINEVQWLPKQFSPNGDGQADVAALIISVSRPTTLEMRLAGDVDNKQIIESVELPSSGRHVVQWNGYVDNQLVEDGFHSVQLVATDSANTNITETANVTVVVDTKKPVFLITGIEDGYLTKGRSSLDLNMQDDALAEFSLSITNTQGEAVFSKSDQGPSLPALQFTVADLAEGNYSYLASAKDAAFNAIDVQGGFTVDLTAPEITLLTPAEADILGGEETQLTLSGTVLDAHLASAAYTLLKGEEIVSEGFLVTDAEGGFSLDIVTESWMSGLYTLTIKATDKAGYETSLTRSIQWDVDAPLIEFGLAEGEFLTKPGQMAGTVTDAHLASYQVYYSTRDNFDMTTATPLFSTTTSQPFIVDWQNLPADGDYRLFVAAEDQLGLTTVRTIGLQIDQTSPPAPLLLLDKSRGAEVNFEWLPVSADDLAGYAIYKGAEFQQVTEQLAFSDTLETDGQYRFSVRARDAAGNESEPLDIDVTIDTTGPEVALTTPANAERVSAMLDIKGTAFSQPDFKAYELSYQLAGQSAVVIASQTLPRKNELLGQLNTYELPSGDAELILTAEDVSGNVSRASVALVIDNEAPASPEQLTVTADGSEISLSWAANTEADLLGYLVYHNGVLFNQSGEVVEDFRQLADAEHQLTATLPDGEHAFYVYAIDHSGNISAPSSTVALTLETGAPTLMLLHPVDGEAFDDSLVIKLDSADEDIAAIRIDYKNQTDTDWLLLTEVSSLSEVIIMDTATWEYGQYDFRAVATDASNNSGEYVLASAEKRDSIVPILTGALTAKATGKQVTLSWPASVDADLERYDVYRKTADDDEFVKVAAVAAGTETYVDSDRNERRYDYQVVAVDSWENESQPIAITDIPVFSLDVNVDNEVTAADTAVLTVVSEFAGRLAIEVWQADALAYNTAATATAGETLSASVPVTMGTNEIKLSLTTAAGHRSIEAVAEVTVAEAPATVQNLQAAAEGYAVNLSWEASSEANVIGYHLYRDGEKLNPGSNNAKYDLRYSSYAYSSSYQLSYANDDSSFYYPYFATHNASNTVGEYLEASFSEPQAITELFFDWYSTDCRVEELSVAAYINDAWQTLLVHNFSEDDLNSITFEEPVLTNKLRLTFDSLYGSCSVRPVKIRELDISTLGIKLNNDYIDRDLTDKEYGYQVSAVNSMGLEGTLSESVSVLVGDHVAPQPVTLEGAVDGSTVTLQWADSASVDVAKYLVYRNDTLFDMVEDTGESDFSVDYTKTKNGSYRYVVKAMDAAGLESEDSNALSLTVDIPVASAPVLNTPQQRLSPLGVEISWQAPQSDVVLTYQLYRKTLASDFSLMSETANHSWTDDAVTLGETYQYYVIALDAAGNATPASNTRSIALLDQTPPQVPVWKAPVVNSTLGYALAGDEQTALAGVGEAQADIHLYANGVYRQTVKAADSLTEVDYSAYSEYPYPTPVPSSPYMVAKGGGATYVYNTDDLSLAAELDYGYSDQFDFRPFSGGWIIREADTGTLLRYDAASQTTQPLVLDLPETVEVLSLFPSATGETFLVAAREQVEGTWVYRLYWLSNEQRLLINEYTESGLAEASVAFAADQTKVAFVYSNVLYAFEAARQSLVAFEAVGGLGWSDSISAIDWHADNQRLVYVNSSGDLYLIDSQAQTVQQVGDDTWRVTQARWLDDDTDQLLMYGRIDYNDGFYRLSVANIAGITKLLSIYLSNGFELTENGQLIVADYEGMTLYAMPGYFTFDAVAVDTGLTEFSAVSTDTAGNVSAMSDLLPVFREQGPFADLTLNGTVLPEMALAEASVSLPITIENIGDLAAEGAQVSVTVYDQLSFVEILNEQIVLGAVSPGEVQTHYVQWQNPSVGDYTAMIQLSDTDDVLSNNSRILNMTLVEAADVALETNVSQTFLSINDVQEVTVSVFNPGLYQRGQLTVTLLDVASNTVQTLADRIDVTLSSLAVETFRYELDGSDLFAGEYQVQARWVSEVSQVEQTAGFEVAAVWAANLATSSSHITALPGDAVVISNRLYRTAGNTIIQNARLQISVQNSAGETVASEQLAVPAMLPNADATLAFAWQTGLTLPGQYQVVSQWLTATGRLLAESQLAVEVLSSEVNLAGELVPVESRIAAGSVAEFTLRVENRSNIALNSMLVNVRSDLFSQPFEQVISLGVGEVYSATLSLPAQAGEPQVHSVVMTASVEGELYELAQTQIETIDVTPPVVTVESPVNGAIINAQFPAVITASDRSGIAAVALRSDLSDWVDVPITVNGYQGSFADWPEGEHWLQAQATDNADLVSETEQISVIIDNTAPQIQIQGAANDAYYSGEVNVNVEVSDAHLSSQVTTLNGESYLGQSLTEEGQYDLHVDALDAAGNFSLANLSFVIDKTAPVISITGVEPDAVYNHAAEVNIEITDANLQLTDVLLNGAVVSGAVVFAEEEGDYVVSVTAIDKALNQTTATLAFSIDTTPPELPVITSPLTGSEVNTETVTLVGTTSPLALLTLTDAAGSKVTTVADADGVFGFESIALSEGENRWQLLAEDQAGNQTTAQEYVLTRTNTLSIQTELQHSRTLLVHVPLSEHRWWRSRHCQKQHSYGTDSLWFDSKWRWGCKKNSASNPLNSTAAQALLSKLNLSQGFKLDEDSEMFATLTALSDAFDEQQLNAVFVATQEDLVNELRSQQYDQVWAVNLNEYSDYEAEYKSFVVDELAAAVAGGTGLVVINAQSDGYAVPLWRQLTGVQFDTYSVDISGVRFAENPFTQRDEVVIATSASRLVPSSGAYRFGQLQCIKRWACKRRSYPAVIVNKYGLGSSVYFAFNVTSLDRQTRSAWLANTVEMSRNVQPRDFEHALVTLVSVVEAESAGGTDLIHEHEGAVLLNAMDKGEVNGNQVLWSVQPGYKQFFRSNYFLSQRENHFYAKAGSASSLASVNEVTVQESEAQDAIAMRLMEGLSDLSIERRYRYQLFRILSDLQWCLSIDVNRHYWSISKADLLEARLITMAGVTNQIAAIAPEQLELLADAARLYQSYSAQWMMLQTDDTGDAQPYRQRE